MPVGAEVEVRSEDPGFAGSFYEATVAGHLPSSSSDRAGNKCYTVVYSTLEGDDGEPLQEAVAAACVRPRPPRATPRRFAVHDMVEALHSEGWWAGVVSAVAPAPAVAGGDLRRRLRRVYQVAFPTSRETIEFQEADLRPHREFVGGRWVPAAKADNASPFFSEGDQVEVSQSGTNFGESWNLATVLKVIGATNFLVKYMHNGKDGKSATEILDSQYIRPARGIIRIDSKYRFSPSHVEVLHEDSWWPGVILKVLGTGIDKKYVVMLDCHKTDLDEIDMDALRVEITQLRPLCDWDGEKWVPCLKKESAKRPISADLDNDLDKISDEPGSHRDKKKLKNAHVLPEQISPLLSVGKENIEITRKPGNAVLAPRSELSPPSLPPMASFGCLSSSSSPVTSCHLAQSSSHIQASLFGAFGQSRTIPQSLPLGTRSLISSCFTGIKGSKKVLSGQDKQSTAGTGAVLFRQMKESANGPQLTSPKRPISADLDNESDKISDEPGSHRDKKKLKNGDVIPEQISPLSSVCKENIEINHKQGNAVLAPRSELSPPSLPPMASFGRLSSSSSPATSCHLAQSSSHIQASLFGAFGQSRPIPQGLPLGTRSLISSCFTGIKGSKKVLSGQDKQSTAGTGAVLFRQMKGCVSFQTAVPLVEKPETPMEGIGAKGIEEGSNIISFSEDRSQSHEGNGTHDSCRPLSAETVAVHESIMHTSGSESSAIQQLPIVKTSPLWAQLEALEIFRTTPQRPNLHQFQQHVPELHEGLALGLMISFADLAESINRLGVQDDDELLERKMECLAYLEASGFDVGDLRSRVEALIHMKNSRAELREALRKLEEEIAREEADVLELGTLLRALAMAVRHLELHAYLVRGVIRSAVARRMNNAMEISRLKAEANNLSTAVPR
uniref:Agenet domain-containing protein n=1 Tax=Aegilops tauschii subsp. strangulata TaxID=200361 RepID=A0A453A887_AEGTS